MSEPAVMMIPAMTPRQAIFHSAELLLTNNNNNNGKSSKKPNNTIQVQGQVAFWDPELQRLDIVHEGAKLIVRTTACCGDNNKIENLQLKSTLVVQGVLKKEQRRTFLEATKVMHNNNNIIDHDEGSHKTENKR